MFWGILSKCTATRCFASAINVYNNLLPLLPNILDLNTTHDPNDPNFSTVLNLCRISLYKIEDALLSAKNKIIPFPWCIVFLAYAISFAIVGVCVYCIVVYGSILGEALTTQWLIAMVIGIAKSIFVIQPAKVLERLIAVCVLRLRSIL